MSWHCIMHDVDLEASSKLYICQHTHFKFLWYINLPHLPLFLLPLQHCQRAPQDYGNLHFNSNSSSHKCTNHHHHCDSGSLIAIIVWCCCVCFSWQNCIPPKEMRTATGHLRKYIGLTWLWKGLKVFWTPMSLGMWAHGRPLPLVEITDTMRAFWNVIILHIISGYEESSVTGIWLSWQNFTGVCSHWKTLWLTISGNLKMENGSKQHGQNQPVPDTIKQYRSYCKDDVFRECNEIVNTLILYSNYISMLLFRKREQKAQNWWFTFQKHHFWWCLKMLQKQHSHQVLVATRKKQTLQHLCSNQPGWPWWCWTSNPMAHYGSKHYACQILRKPYKGPKESICPKTCSRGLVFEIKIVWQID